jgi:ATP-dependent exoDNAse (exonuclease V) beta subunit
MKDEILKKLDCFIDPLFKFDPKLHRYTYDDEVLQSVTKTVEKFHKPFDTEAVAKRTSEKTGVDAEILKKEWAETNRYANVVGTATHEWIEDYFNGNWKSLPTNPDIIHRINKFNKIFCSHLHKLTPVKFETRIFSKKWKLAGTIDALFLKDDKLYILDYKTNKDFKDDEHKDGKWEKLLDPFGDFYKNHHNEYSIQLCLYAAILEQWGIDIAGAYLVYIGPGDDDARLIKVKDMRPIIKDYFDSIL